MHFGTLPSGQDVLRVRLQNKHLSLNLMTYGASIQSLSFKGQAIVLGSEILEDYLDRLIYCGAIVGRVANRIANARSIVAGKPCQFDANEPNGNCLHGGVEGSGQQVWSLLEHGAEHAVFTLDIADGHMGFPGNLKVNVRYELRDATLRVILSATTDQETLCAFASHGYWNLTGDGSIDAHQMQVFGDHYLPLDANNIPTGQIAPVAGTGFDFRELRALNATEIDHNFCISKARQTMRPVLSLRSEESGITLDVSSTESGVQVYDGRHIGRTGLAIEPQVWPDATNHQGFPNMVLKPGDTYESISDFKLSQTAHS